VCRGGDTRESKDATGRLGPGCKTKERGGIEGVGAECESRDMTGQAEIRSMAE